MSQPWNLTSEQWSEVLLDDFRPEAVAASVRKADVLPWADVLLEYTEPFRSVVDLGSGRGENAATLALHGKQATLVDWSSDNLAFSRQLFDSIRVGAQFCRADITKPLPFKSNSVDVVYSCGVFEYFTREQVRSMLAEAFRVARKRVIIMVPNALSVPYRFGMWYMKRTGQWNWGGEVPSYTLKADFANVGASHVSEFTVAPQHSLHFLTMPTGRFLRRACRRVLGTRHEAGRAPLRQGYLLVTIGDKRWQ